MLQTDTVLEFLHMWKTEVQELTESAISWVPKRLCHLSQNFKENMANSSHSLYSQMSIFLACRLQSWCVKERRCLWRGQWGTFCNEGMFNKFKLIRYTEIGLFYTELHSLKNISRVEPLLNGWNKPSSCPRWAMEMNPAVIQPHFYTELSAY